MPSVIRSCKRKPYKEIDRFYTMIIDENIGWVKHVEKFIVGNSHPLKLKSEAQHQKDLDALNRALRYGKMIGYERNYVVINTGSQELVCAYMVYHVGFKHKPNKPS